jgi:hypothetical protein
MIFRLFQRSFHYAIFADAISLSDCLQPARQPPTVIAALSDTAFLPFHATPAGHAR